MRLLDALELHIEWLQGGHEDARRLALEELPPGYLLDFELIFRYMLRAAERPDWAQELEYLFDHERTTFLIGPGTRVEIDKFMDEVGFALDSEGEPEARRRRWRRRDYGYDQETLALGLHRLGRLLARPNVMLWQELADPHIDEEAFAIANAALSARRSGASAIEANASDAMNWAAVIYLRAHRDAPDITFHPYLLTATKPLLNERVWTSDVVGPVSRQPSDAIYVDVLLDTFETPTEALDHTVRVSWEAASLKRDLQLSPAYLNPHDHQHDPEFAQAIEQNLVTDELRTQLEGLSSFVTDPIVTRTQRIYDNASLAEASITQQRGEVLPVLTRSPRRLFDLIVEVSGALGARDQAPGMADLWDKVLELAVHQQGTRRTYELLDRTSNGRAPQYLVVDRYEASASQSDQADAEARESPQFVLRWPSALDAEDVLELFSRAFSRHEAGTVAITIGTDAGVEHYQAELPISLKQLMAEIETSARPRGHRETLTQLWWIRMGAPDFDLYADVSPPGVVAEPIIGVFVDRLNAAHLQDLYGRTSARYLFPAWLQRAVEAIAADSG
jgi:hypothetical protein